MMLMGLFLLLLGAVIDFLEEFRQEIWVVAGADAGQVLEDFVLPLGGVGLLVGGIVRWVPMHAAMHSLKARQEIEIDRLRAQVETTATFVSTAAHELASPLTVLRLQVETLHEKTDEASVRLFGRSIARLERLVEDLLDSSKLQAGRLRFEMQRTDIAPVLAEVQSAFRPQCEAKGIAFHVEVGSNSLWRGLTKCASCRSSTISSATP